MVARWGIRQAVLAAQSAAFSARTSSELTATILAAVARWRIFAIVTAILMPVKLPGPQLCRYGRCRAARPLRWRRLLQQVKSSAPCRRWPDKNSHSSIVPAAPSAADPVRPEVSTARASGLPFCSRFPNFNLFIYLLVYIGRRCGKMHKASSQSNPWCASDSIFSLAKSQVSGTI